MPAAAPHPGTRRRRSLAPTQRAPPARGPAHPPAGPSLMIATHPPVPVPEALQALHQGFLPILERLRRYAHVVFRDKRCSHARDDAVAEVVALSWRWYLNLARSGKDPGRFPGAL